MMIRILPPALWLIALCLSFGFYPTYQSEMVGGSILCLILAGLIALHGGIIARVWTLPRDKILLIGGVFWCVALGSVIWSQIPWISFVHFWVFSCLPLSILLFLGKRKETDIIEKILIFMISALALCALTQYYMIPNMLLSGRVAYPLQNPNSLGAFFSLGAFLAIGQYFKTRTHTSLLSFILILLGLVTTGSRGALGACLIMICVLLFVFRKEITWKFLLMIALGISSLALIVMFTSIRPDNTAIGASLRVMTSDIPLLWSRGDIWQATSEMIRAHPWLGTGLGTFPQFYEQYRAPEEFSAGFTAHNDPLQFWAEMGIAAFLLVYLFGVSLCVRTWKALQATDNLTMRLNILVPFCALGAMAIHSHISFNLYIMPILLLSGFFLSLWSTATSSALEKENILLACPKILSPQKGEFLLVLTGLLLAIMIVPPFVSNYHVNQAEKYNLYQDTHKFVDHVNQAERWAFGFNAQPYILAAPLQITMLEQDIDILMSTKKKQRIEEIENLLSRAQALNPRAVGVYYNRALLAQLLTQDDPAYGDIDKFLEEGLRYKPRHLPSRLWLVERYENRGENKKALEVMQDGFKWCTRQSTYRTICTQKMATLLVKNGDIKGSAEMLRRVHALNTKK